MRTGPTIRVTKIFNFEMAHALLGYDGDCKNIHGHSYKLHITLIGMALNEPDHPKHGMVIDFKDIKKLVKSRILEQYDHALVLNVNVNPDLIKTLTSNFEKVVLTSYQPTCELLLNDFVEKIMEELPVVVKLHSAKLYETETSFSEWYQSDNQ